VAQACQPPGSQLRTVFWEYSS